MWFPLMFNSNIWPIVSRLPDISLQNLDIDLSQGHSVKWDAIKLCIYYFLLLSNSNNMSPYSSYCRSIFCSYRLSLGPNFGNIVSALIGPKMILGTTRTKIPHVYAFSELRVRGTFHRVQHSRSWTLPKAYFTEVYSAYSAASAVF